MAQQQPVTTPLDALSTKDFLIIKGARVNNLKNINVAIPRNKLVVLTGLSGSGKSSLAFDTIFAEGQRMYIESLSAYARQFLGKLEKPDVDYIRGISPAIAIEQKSHNSNPNSTVGTITEIYDYLKLLYARIGITYSPISGKIVHRETVTDVIDYLYKHPSGTKVMLFYPLTIDNAQAVVDRLKIEMAKGFTRVLYQGTVKEIEELIQANQLLNVADVAILVDRFVLEPDNEEMQFRITDSIETAFFEGKGCCYVEIIGQGKRVFTDRFEQDGMSFEVPSVNLFSFNNSYGVCKSCDINGKVQRIDPEKVIPNKNLSIREGAIFPWHSKSMHKWIRPLLEKPKYKDFPIYRPYKDLSEEEKKFLWEGDDQYKGINYFFDFLEKEASNSFQNRLLINRYRGFVTCPDCLGTRIRKDANYVKVGGESIAALLLMPLTKLASFFQTLSLPAHETKIAQRLLTEINNRLQYMEQVGLGYLVLNRPAATLSGGEFQRIKLANALGSNLVDTLYILDEPTVGLHPRDTHRLIEILLTLKELGNTVLVVEHEEALMKVADELIDIGPDAGSKGGELVFQGDWNDLKCFKGTNSHTALYLKGIEKIPVPKKRRPVKSSFTIHEAQENNLKNIEIQIPLGVLTVITGVSGSGKSTLVKKIIYPALAAQLGKYVEYIGKYGNISGEVRQIQAVELIEQNAIGRSSRSNPVTYIKAYDAIRELYAKQPLALQRNYSSYFFSFNLEGGRCEACQGEGKINIEMQFMADVVLTCESCKGRRFQQAALEVKYKEKDIADVLEMTVDDACHFFKDITSIYKKLQPLQDAGLGYITLGQSSSTLSGGEAQRLKLATYLVDKCYQQPTLFIFDEPTTGLHVHDIQKLLLPINRLIDAGNSVIIVEHNIELIKCADWIIDLGPEGGDEGGTVVFSGTPEDMVQTKGSYTALYLKEKLECAPKRRGKIE